MSRISKFGILELSRQKKQSTIQEISYNVCPYCKGRGVRPSLEYTALGAFRKIESQAVKGDYSVLKVKLPYEIADYLLNRKRNEISKLEATYNVSIHISGSPDIPWDELKIETVEKEVIEEASPEEEIHPVEAPDKQENERAEPAVSVLTQAEIRSLPQEINAGVETIPKPAKKKSKWRPRHRKKKAEDKSVEPLSRPPAERSDNPVAYKRIEQAQDSAVNAPAPSGGTGGEGQDLLTRLRKVFEQIEE
jgi:ribonuclease E